MSERLLGIKEICQEYNLTGVYVRKMIQKGRLVPDQKKQIMNNTFKYLFKESTVAAWRGSIGTKVTQRKDGRRKYNVYMTSEERKQFDDWKAQSKLEIPLKVANPSKTK